MDAEARPPILVVTPPCERPSARVLRLWYEFMVLARREAHPASDWSADVKEQICPRDDQSFRAWMADVVPLHFAREGAAVRSHGSLERALRVLPKDVANSPPAPYLRVYTVDERASKEQILKELAEHLSFRPRGRPARGERAIKWINYAPNGDVDVVALTKALWVRKRRDRLGRSVTNEQLWDSIVRRLLPPGRRRLAVDPDVKRSEVSRHLKRAREVVQAVRSGAFPFDRPRQKGVGTVVRSRDGDFVFSQAFLPAQD